MSVLQLLFLRTLWCNSVPTPCTPCSDITSHSQSSWRDDLLANYNWAACFTCMHPARPGVICWYHLVGDLALTWQSAASSGLTLTKVFFAEIQLQTGLTTLIIQQLASPGFTCGRDWCGNGKDDCKTTWPAKLTVVGFPVADQLIMEALAQSHCQHSIARTHARIVKQELVFCQFRH